MTSFVHVACGLCGADDGEVVYRRSYEAGPVLGRIDTSLALWRCYPD